MKNTILIFGITITTLGLFAFANVSKHYSNEAKTCAVEQNQDHASLNFFNVEGRDVERVKENNRDLFYLVRGKYQTPITKEALQNANTLGDIIKHYPSSWIEEYTSVDIYTAVQGKQVNAKGDSEELSPSQKEVLSQIDMSTDIDIAVKFKAQNQITKNLEDRQMNINMTVVPDVQAEYAEGYDEMIDYLEANSVKEVKAIPDGELSSLSIFFTVNEKGETTNIRMNMSCGDVSIDNLIMQLIEDMPLWKPAMEANGTKVSQVFEFNYLNGMDGC